MSNLTKSFNGFLAVNDLSFEVQKNKVFGFLGPNGAGKTTTIRMIAGLLKPDKGQIKLSGKEILFGQSRNLNLFGYLSEQPSFYNWMTGWEYLNFMADLFQIDKQIKKKRLGGLLKITGIENFKNRKIGTYSGGMRQRLGIAQALINQPEILILDEPVSSLDPIGRKDVLRVIEQLKEDKTIFMSTHILADVDRVCDDVAIINEGELVIQSPLAVLKEKYAKPLLEVEFIRDPSEIIKSLSIEKWQHRIEKNGNKLRIWLSDEKLINKNDPIKFLTQFNIGILRYGLTLPETEDLFMELVKKKE